MFNLFKFKNLSLSPNSASLQNPQLPKPSPEQLKNLPNQTLKQQLGSATLVRSGLLEEMEKPKISIPLPKNVEYILNCIETQGEGFIVGGAVRDNLLGKKPKDYDITTNLSYQRL